jgi:hypothetical protein
MQSRPATPYRVTGFCRIGRLLVLVGMEKLAEALAQKLNGKISASRDRGSDCEIYPMNVEGTNRTNIPNGPNSDAWSSGCLSS